MHMRVHTKERPLKCNLCDRTFSESSNLAKHRRTHAAEGSFHCDFPSCKKTFHRQDQLRRHLKTHAKKVARQASVSQASVSVSPRPSEEPEPESESEMQP
ncbi:zinc-finger protein [Pyricularia oryzae]